MRRGDLEWSRRQFSFIWTPQLDSYYTRAGNDGGEADGGTGNMRLGGRSCLIVESGPGLRVW